MISRRHAETTFRHVSSLPVPAVLTLLLMGALLGVAAPAAADAAGPMMAHVGSACG